MKKNTHQAKKVYVAMAVDFIHPGHINIIDKAKEYGVVTVGVLTDEAIASYKRVPILNYEFRKRIINNIKGVDKVVEQSTTDYRPNLIKIKPDYVVHGDDWNKGVGSEIRKQVIDTLDEWGGKLIEVEYTKGMSSTDLIRSFLDRGVTPTYRMKSLKKLIDNKPIVRFLEAHNGLTGLIVETLAIKNGTGLKEFDGIWASSLTDSAAKGKPDIEVVGWPSRYHTIEEIIEVTTKPMIVDGDTGGRVEHFKYSIKTLERLGISAVIIEDKIGLKRNSLFGTDVDQTQDSIENFCGKIIAGKKSQTTEDFMIIARIESLILGGKMQDALKRAGEYVSAGADGIMIHSKGKDGKEIYEFCSQYKKLGINKPLVIVPTTFSHIKESELMDWGVKIVIYANHLLRSAYPQMVKAAKSILKNERSKEASEKYCMPIKDIISLIPEKY